MKSTIFTFIFFWLVMGSAVTSAQTRTENFSKVDILAALDDDPLRGGSYSNTGPKFFNSLYHTDIYEMFHAILKNDIYRNDAEIRKKLMTLSETHPYTDIRAAALLILSDFRSEHHGDNILRRLPIFWHQSGYTGPTNHQINEQMEYCHPPPEAKRPDFEIKAEASAKALNHGRPIYTFDIPMKYGTLSGGYYTILGVGLTYKQYANPDITIGINNFNNRYVMKADSENTYWLIDGPHHMIGGASISKLVETKDGIKQYFHRVLPSGVKEVFELSNGGVFMTFSHLDPSKRGGTWTDNEFTPSQLEHYNPPIILHPNGKINLACTDKAVEF